MNNQTSRSKLITALFIVVILTTVLLFQFGAVQAVRGQTDCGLPGQPPCDNPPANSPTAVIIYPTRPPAPTATFTPTVTVTPTVTPVPTRPPVPTSTPITASVPTVTPTVNPTARPTPKPGFIPQLVINLPQPPPFLIALAPRPNIEVINVEITQAIQCLGNSNCPDNSLRLFIGKPTMVRLYVRISPGGPWFSVSGIGGELCPGIHNVQGCANPVHSINYVTVTKVKSTVDVSYLRGNINSTLNFILPSSWTYGNFTVYVNMKGEDYPLEATLNDNFITQPFQENPSQRLDVMFVPVKSRGFAADLNERWKIHDWLTLAFPTSNIQIWQMSGFINNTPDTYDWNDKSGGCGDGWGDLLDDLDWYKGNNPQIFYAMVHILSLKGTPYAGCGRFTSKVAAGAVNTGDRNGPEVAAQEIGHTMQRNHAPGCSAGNPDNSYPNSGGTLDEYGVDVTRNQVYIPSQTYDYMGYCGGESDTWTSMYTYNAIASLLPNGVFVPGGQGSTVAQQPGPSTFSPVAPISFNLGGTGLPAINLVGVQSSAAPEAASAASQYFVGSGSITPQNVSLKRGFFLLGTDSVALRTPETGPYMFELLDDQGNVLSSLPFKPQEESNEMPGDTGTFHLTIPWVEEARGYQFKYNGTVIGGQTADPHQPSVEDITSTGGSHWPNTGTVTISWKPVYAGSNPLQFLVQYSRDNGITWSMLTINQDQTTLDVDASLVAGSPQAQIRVFVSDGFNTGEALSAPFTVDDKTPDVHIGWTGDDAQVMGANPVFLNGAATDAQDGPIAGSALHWSVDNNPLSDGDTLITSTLGIGDHVITLSATNAEGLTGTTSIHLTVLPPAPKPQSTAELSFFGSLLLWAILLAVILLLALGGILLLRKSHRKEG